MATGIEGGGCCRSAIVAETGAQEGRHDLTSGLAVAALECEEVWVLSGGALSSLYMLPFPSIQRRATDLFLEEL